MQIPLQVTFHGIPSSDAVEAAIRAKVDKLGQFSTHVMSCRVVVENVNRHSRQGRLFNVRIDINLAGRELVVNRDQNEDLYVVLRDAFDAARRLVEDEERRLRGNVKNHEPLIRGRIVRLFDEGYGFIETPDGREFYFSRENVVDPAFLKLAVGDEVQFLEEFAADGRQAKRVSVGKHHIAD